VRDDVLTYLSQHKSVELLVRLLGKLISEALDIDDSALHEDILRSVRTMSHGLSSLEFRETFAYAMVNINRLVTSVGQNSVDYLPDYIAMEEGIDMIRRVLSKQCDDDNGWVISELQQSIDYYLPSDHFMLAFESESDAIAMARFLTERLTLVIDALEVARDKKLYVEYVE
jgi:hypothetical protein